MWLVSAAAVWQAAPSHHAHAPAPAHPLAPFPAIFGPVPPSLPPCAVRFLLGVQHDRRNRGHQRHCDRRGGQPERAGAGRLRHQAGPRLQVRRGRLCCIASSVCVGVPLLQLLTLPQLSLTSSPRDCVVAASLQASVQPILHGDPTYCFLLPACLACRLVGTAVEG